MNFNILTKADRKTGFGHVTRCMSLLQACKEKGLNASFIVDGDMSVTDFLGNVSHQFMDIQNCPQELYRSVKGADVVFIDSYQAEISFYEHISQSVKVPVYIDDIMRLNYPGGIVVNSTIFAEQMNYPKRRDIIYLLGSKYTPIRKAFWDIPDKTIPKEITCFMVTFGGEDPLNMTPKIMEVLAKNFPDSTKDIVVGKGFQNIQEIKKFKDSRTNLICDASAETMKNVMLRSDVAISAGGQTLYELARVGVPTIAIAVADNQQNNMKGWHKAGFIEYDAELVAHKALDKVILQINAMKAQHIREEKSLNGRRMINGNGALNICNEIIKVINSEKNENTFSH